MILSSVKQCFGNGQFPSWRDFCHFMKCPSLTALHLSILSPRLSIPISFWALASLHCSVNSTDWWITAVNIYGFQLLFFHHFILTFTGNYLILTSHLQCCYQNTYSLYSFFFFTFSNSDKLWYAQLIINLSFLLHDGNNLFPKYLVTAIFNFSYVYYLL
jgi:hypothetical protein